jgi:quercetin dioxygenase-like cupin family protein
MKTVIYLILAATLMAGCAAPRYSTEIETSVLAQSTQSWDRQTLPAYPKGQPEITILRIIIPPHTTLPMHQHPVINAGVLLKGELTVITDQGETLYLKPYDSIIEVVDKWHYGKNEGDTPAEIIVFYAGEPESLITVKRKPN